MGSCPGVRKVGTLLTSRPSINSMPELPEVENVVRSLRPLLVGARFLRGQNHRDSLRLPLPSWTPYENQRFSSVERYGKYILIDFENHSSWMVHLGMSGRFHLPTQASPSLAHTHVHWWLEKGVEVQYVDPRRFGFIQANSYPSRQGLSLQNVGPDPFHPTFSAGYLGARLSCSQRVLKDLLLHQQIVAGLGNIYVAEVLFQAGLSPFRRGCEVTVADAQKLYQAIRYVLQSAIENGGTTLSEKGYVNAQGIPGRHRTALAVYGRAGKPCPLCEHPVVHVVQGQRSTYYCSFCQV